MAYLLYNGNNLVWDGCQAQFASSGVPLTVGFYQINGTNISRDPSLSLCYGLRYAVRVSVPDLNTGGLGLFLAPNLDLIPPTEIGGLPGSDGLLDFEILQTGPIILNRKVKARLGFDNGEFSLLPTPDPQSVGYPHGLPILLNSCQFCECPLGSSCGPAGVCKTSLGPCPERGFCGSRNGQCSGRCPSGYDCLKINGFYTCQTNNTNDGSFWVVMSFVIIFLVLAAVMLFMIYRSSQNNEPVLMTIDEL